MQSSMLATLDTYCNTGSRTRLQSVPSFTNRILKHTLAETRHKFLTVFKSVLFMFLSFNGDFTSIF